MNVPDGLWYTDEHEWIRLEGETAVVGVTEYAQQELGDVVYVELPELGEVVEQKGSFGAVESVKAASDLYSPVAAEVIGVNEALTDSPELINKEPYGDGWIIEIRPTDWDRDRTNLLDAQAYRAILAE